MKESVILDLQKLDKEKTTNTVFKARFLEICNGFTDKGLNLEACQYQLCLLYWFKETYQSGVAQTFFTRLDTLQALYSSNKPRLSIPFSLTNT